MGAMSGDVIPGSEGKPRCAWVGASDTGATRYHDEVWGTRTYDESALFEALTLGVVQAEAFARQLKSQGYRFVGPTSVYAFMQNVGVVNDHVLGCFRAIKPRRVP